MACQNLLSRRHRATNCFLIDYFTVLSITTTKYMLLPLQIWPGKCGAVNSFDLSVEYTTRLLCYRRKKTVAADFMATSLKLVCQFNEHVERQTFSSHFLQQDPEFIFLTCSWPLTVLTQWKCFHQWSSAVCSSNTLVQTSQESHDWTQRMETNGSSDCHRHTCGIMWFHTFTVFLHLNLYSNKTNSTDKKKDQLFSQKRKYNDFNIRTGKKKNN